MHMHAAESRMAPGFPFCSEGSGLRGKGVQLGFVCRAATLYLWQPQDFNLCKQRNTLL